MVLVAVLDTHRGLATFGFQFFLSQFVGALGGFHQQLEGGLHILQGYPVLGPLGACQAGLHVAHVQLQGIAVQRLMARFAPQALGLGIGLHQRQLVVFAAGQFHVSQGLVIHREETAGGTVFRGHIGDGGPVRHRHILETVAVEFHELAHDAFLAQHLGDRQHQVSGGDALTQLAGDLEAYDLGDQHRYRLTQHGGFRFNAAHAPAQDAQAIDHGGVGVGTHQGIRIGKGFVALLLVPHRLAQVLKVYLVANAGTRRYHTEVVKGLLAPAQELIAFLITLHLNGNVVLESRLIPELVHHDGVINHQVNGGQRVDQRRVLAGLAHRLTHGGQVHHTRHAGKVLHQHPRRAELDFGVGATVLQPLRHGLKVLFLNGDTVFKAQQVFRQHLEGIGHSVEIAQFLASFRQTVVVVSLALYVQR